MIQFVFEMVENSLGKGENTGILALPRLFLSFI